MKFETLLQQAAACQSDDDADNLLKVMVEAFTQCAKAKQLIVANESAHMEDNDGPYVEFDLNWVISDHYIIKIAPEIRNGQATIVVEPYHLKDGHGMASQNYGIVIGAEEEVIDDTEDRTVEEVLDLAVEAAIKQYRDILVTVGLTGDYAALTARSRFFAPSAT